jgi:hypothetical protein
MEVIMRNVKWLVAAGLVAVTAGCVESSGYPNTSYNRGGYNSGYANNSGGYYGCDGRYYSTNTASPRSPSGDYDRDGVPNRYDRDANGDGVPDRYQR